MTAIILIAIAVGFAALAPRYGAEDRPGFDEHRPLV
jgi:hypothetical protein